MIGHRNPWRDRASNLVFGGAIEDDSLIDDLRIRRGEVREGGELRIHIQGMHEA